MKDLHHHRNKLQKKEIIKSHEHKNSFIILYLYIITYSTLCQESLANVYKFWVYNIHVHSAKYLVCHHLQPYARDQGQNTASLNFHPIRRFHQIYVLLVFYLKY